MTSAWKAWLGWGGPKETKNETSSTHNTVDPRLISEEDTQKAFVNIASRKLNCGYGSGVDLALDQKPTSQSSKSCSYAATTSTSADTSSQELLNPLNNMPVRLADMPAVSGSLGVQRQVSSIPRASTALPTHQEGTTNNAWVYPSESMFYNAMARKGWQPRAEDMSTVVAIHNSVNERAWREVLAWEAMHQVHCPGPPALKRFTGKPDEYSPKARFLNMLGFRLPFDRHDWVVDRCGREVRYVIDFYSGPPSSGSAAGVFIDARPALDSFGALWDRLQMQLRWVRSGRWAGNQ